MFLSVFFSIGSYFASFAKSFSFLGIFKGTALFLYGANDTPNNKPVATPAKMPKNNFPVLMMLFF
jgi:hypothetical protein